MHLRLLEHMALDLAAGERAILLIGNQGTGKNKLADRLLEILGREREYMQLHRDSTVQSLTVEASLIGGAVKWRDSPLVLALRYGRVLMLDEADKAPLEVDGHAHVHAHVHMPRTHAGRGRQGAT